MSDNRTIEEQIADKEKDLLRHVTNIQTNETELSNLKNRLIMLQKSGKLTDKYKITLDIVKESYPDITWGGRS